MGGGARHDRYPSVCVTVQARCAARAFLLPRVIEVRIEMASTPTMVPREKMMGMWYQ